MDFIKKNPILVIESVTRRFTKKAFSAHLAEKWEKYRADVYLLLPMLLAFFFRILLTAYIAHITGYLQSNKTKLYQCYIRKINENLPDEDKPWQLDPSQTGKSYYTERENTKEMQSMEGKNHIKHISFNSTLTFVWHQQSSIINSQPSDYKLFHSLLSATSLEQMQFMPLF